MTGHDLAKLKALGVRVFCYQGLTIYEKVFGTRIKVQTCKTRAELKRAWDFIMDNPKHISC